MINLELLKKQCQEPKWIDSKTVLELIQTIESQQQELDSWRSDFMI